MSKKITYKTGNEPLPLISSYLDRFNEELLEEISAAGKGEDEEEDGEKNEQVQ